MFKRKEKTGNGAAPKQVKASLAYTISSIVQRSMSIITLPIFSRMLTTEEYGLATVYSSTMTLLIIFTSLQLPYGSFNKAMIKFKEDRRGYISSVNSLCFVLMLAYMIVYLCFQKMWNAVFKLPVSLMIVMGVEMLMATSLKFWMGYNRFEYKYKEVVSVTLFSSLASTGVAIIAVLLSEEKGMAKVLAYSGVAIIIGAFFFLDNLLKGKKLYHKEYWKYALSFNIPLIPYYLSQMIFNQSDRLMIDSICGRGDAAKYGVAYNLAIVITFILTSINQSYTPWLYEKIKEKNFEKNKKISLGIAFGLTIMIFGVVVFAPEIIYIMAGKQYQDAMWVVPPVAMSLLFLFYTQLFANIEFYYEEKYFLVAGSIFSAIINVVLNYILLPVYGYVAAGYTTLISYILFAVLNYVCMRFVCKKHNISGNIYDGKKMVLLAVGFMVLAFGVVLLYPYNYLRYGVVALSVLLVGINYKRLYSKLLYYITVFKEDKQ